MKSFSTLILALALTLCGQAQVSLRDCFKAMPDSIVPYLSENNRLDMLDFLDAGMKGEVTNLLEGRSEMTAHTADSITLRLSESLKVKLLLAPLAAPVDSVTQALVWISTYTITGGAGETSISYFTPTWKPLPEGFKLAPQWQAVIDKIAPSTLLEEDEKVKYPK